MRSSSASKCAPLKGGRAELSGFTLGAMIWVRVRKIGTKGETGGWSDPASIMVT